MAEWVNEAAAMWWRWMAAVSVQAGVLILLVGLADVLLRRWAGPQLRYALYLLVLAKLVVGPGFTSPASVTWRVGPWTDQAVWAVGESAEQATVAAFQEEAGGDAAVSQPHLRVGFEDNGEGQAPLVIAPPPHVGGFKRRCRMAAA